jgi:hypothetical protein
MTYVQASNISAAWREAATLLSAPGRDELVPLVVTFRGLSSTAIDETEAVRQALDEHINKNEKFQPVDTVAGTIFPSSLWNRDKPRARLFERYNAVLDRLHKATPKNRRGLYFERMTSGGPEGAENQLDFVLGQFTSRSGVRRSALQVATFQPALDHSASARLGFPCLQHVVFTPVEDSDLHVSAFYATQYLVERAYGNYLGLARLGQFVAHELSRELTSVTCVAGIAVRDVSQKALRSILQNCSEAASSE